MPGLSIPPCDMSASLPPPTTATPQPPRKRSIVRNVAAALLWLAGLGVAGTVAGVLMVALALVLVYPHLPDVSNLADYRPKLPLRVYSSEGALLGEFGEERRMLTPIDEMPQVMLDALLAVEDARFFRHKGVDPKGLARAVIANILRPRSQGASTITMQVARNVYLSSDKKLTRKLYEVALTFKMEYFLSKRQILEIYMNQVFLGQRAYGFAVASETYFGKPLKNITVAEAAMLAGLPQSPSRNNPVNNPKKARERQLHVIARMQYHGFITAEQAQQARDETLALHQGSAAPRPEKLATRIHAEYVAEMVRQAIHAQYGEAAYTRGLNVYTSINAGEQEAAYQALRQGIIAYERRQKYRGPEGFINLPSQGHAREDAIDEALSRHPDNGDMLAAVVLHADARRVVVARADAAPVEITGNGLKPVESGLREKAAADVKIRPGAVVRMVKNPKGEWELTQLPEVEGAFVALEPQTGAVRALVGGFDFKKNKFNHATQAWRQPGSSFKPFIYSAALENGFSPATLINDEPLYFGTDETGSAPWQPKNYDDRYDGPMTLRTALSRSKNMVSIQLVQAIGAQQTQQWVTRFGFEAKRHPAYLTLALGAGAVTPLQLAAAYTVFANGGYRVHPWLIARITDHKGRILAEYHPPPLEHAPQAITARNAFVMDTLLQEVTRAGTAARAQRELKRADLYGKTGTTNDQVDTWFAGFHPTLAAVAWVGYDQPRNLGSRETGGGLSLPIWIGFMQHALKGVPVTPLGSPPPGVVQHEGDWYYAEYADGSGVSSLEMETAAEPAAITQERQRILQLFRD